VKVIYTLVEPDTKKIRYVGRTGDNINHRARLHWVYRYKGSRPIHLWLQTLDAPPPIEVLQEVEDHEWIAAEKYWINLLAQVPTVDLLNVAGHLGRTYTMLPKSAETRAKMSAARKGRPAPWAHGHPTISDETVEAIRRSSATYYELVKQFNVSLGTVSAIKNRRGRFSQGTVE